VFDFFFFILNHPNIYAFFSIFVLPLCDTGIPPHLL